jgi:hypothetical protein
MKALVSMATLALTSAFVSPALAVNPPLSRGAAPLVITIQDEENKELWRDLETSQTPPEAAVGKKKQHREAGRKQ